MITDLPAHQGFFINGDFVRAAGDERYTSVSSTTGQPLGSYPVATTADIDRAVAAAGARSEWHDAEPAQRAKWMYALADAIESRSAAMADLIAQEVGTPIGLASAANAISFAALLRYYADLAERADHQDNRYAPDGVRTVVRRVPVGVVAMIMPWNYPLGLIGFKLGPALATGCTAVIKPSPETGLDSYLLAEAVREAQLPPGVINIVPADRPEGEYLVTHPGVHKVSFTGSSAAGMRVGGLCGQALKPVTLELGGKSAAVLLDDVDLDLFLKAIPLVSLLNNGQTCLNNTRILVPKVRYAEASEAIASLVAGMRVGDPLDAATQVGPLVAARQRDRVEGYIASGIEEGATVLAGRGGPARDTGWFVEPTVFGDVQPHMRIFREEIFGPVLALSEYDGGDDAAVALANDSDYGLAGSVWSADVERGLAVAERVETGTIGVNIYTLSRLAPFEGWKNSGLGRELGPEALESYLKYQAITMPAVGASA